MGADETQMQSNVVWIGWLLDEPINFLSLVETELGQFLSV